MILGTDNLLQKDLKNIQAYDIAEIFHDLEVIHQKRVIDLISDKKASEVFSRLTEYQQKEVFFELDNITKKRILDNLEIDELKEFIAYYEKEEQDDILSFVMEDKANIIKDLLIYSNDLAPSIMTTEYLSININKTIKEATSYIFNNVKEDDFIDNIYVIDEEEKLVGVLSLKDLIVARASDSISELMDSEYNFAYNDNTIKEAIKIVRSMILPHYQ